jgi:hypothetical protein
MTMNDRNLDEKISKWLEAEAPRQIPDRVLSATFERTRKTAQHRWWQRAIATFHMGGTLNAFGAAVVVLVVVSIAAAAFALGPGRGFISGGPGTPAPTVEPTIEPTPAPTTSASPAPTDPPTPTPSVAAGFLGTWLAMDPPPESSHLTMQIGARSDGDYDVTIHDDAAAVCATVASTMSGVAQETEPGTIVIARPDFTCDDGTKPHSLNGLPFKDLIRNYTLIYDAQRDELNEPDALNWTRAPAAN